MEKKTVYQRLKEADKKGRGLRLSAEDVARLMSDDAISTRAELDERNKQGESDRDCW